jgi:hypothetical protein
MRAIPIQMLEIPGKGIKAPLTIAAGWSRAALCAASSSGFIESFQTVHHTQNDNAVSGVGAGGDCKEIRLTPTGSTHEAFRA